MTASPLPAVTEVLPHRPPFLFVDRVLEVSPEAVRAVRTFHADEPFFQGHFPGGPVVPGVLLVEGLAQTMAYGALLENPHALARLVSIDHARFFHPVLPGTEVTYLVTLGEDRFGLRSAQGVVAVGGQKVAEAQLRGFSGGPHPFSAAST